MILKLFQRHTAMVFAKTVEVYCSNLVARAIQCFYLRKMKFRKLDLKHGKCIAFFGIGSNWDACNWSFVNFLFVHIKLKLSSCWGISLGFICTIYVFFIFYQIFKPWIHQYSRNISNKFDIPYSLVTNWSMDKNIDKFVFFPFWFNRTY